MNLFKTGFLMSLLTGLFLVVGALIGGGAGMVIAFAVRGRHQSLRLLEFGQGAAVHVWRAAGGCGKRARSFAHRGAAGGAGQAAHAQGLHHRKSAAQRLRHRAQSRACRGVRHHADCSRSVSKEELAGVLAHELGHVQQSRHADHDHHGGDRGRHRHAGEFRFLHGRRPRAIRWASSACLLVTMLAPIAAMLVQAAISRSREFEADRAGRGTDRPAAVAGRSRLAQIDRAARADFESRPPTPIPPRRICSSSIRCMAACRGLFASHPSTEERIARLRAMAGVPAPPGRPVGLTWRR